MPIQAGTFKPLPPKEEIEALIEEEKRHLVDLTSYLWYVMPVAEKFGDRVYEVAAQSLTESGIETDAAQLKALAEELRTPEGQARYAEHKKRHLAQVTG